MGRHLRLYLTNSVLKTQRQRSWANGCLIPGWVCTTPTPFIDQWCVGEALRSNGDKGLYMSNSDGQNSDVGKRYVFVNIMTGEAEYIVGNPKYVQFAYRDFVLPTGNYYVSFDYISPNMQLAAGYVTFVRPPTAQSNQITLQRGTDVLPSVISLCFPYGRRRNMEHNELPLRRTTAL